ncbi:hypothetical protein KBC59_01710 [Patescibacteria group bacterium]|jgi:hypothetical protein|nr:hypothetical protein [Patescibacteria group bacterium]
MPLRSHHFSGIVLGALALLAISIVYGLHVSAEEARVEAFVAPKVTYPGAPFVGMPKTMENLLNCRVFGKAKKRNSYYYIREEVTNTAQLGSLRELYCFANEQDAKAKGFKTKKKPPTLESAPTTR